MLIDTHAHHLSKSTQIVVGLHAKAFHPWELPQDFDRKVFDQKFLELKASAKDIIAVGECGLDRVHEGIASIADQIYVLEKHFEWAEQENLPLIIHSVRTHSDILGLLKRRKFKGVFMLHAFHGNEVEMHEYLKYDVYFTYGAKILKNDQMLKITPRERLLLETGDQTEVSLEAIYEACAHSLGIEKEELEKKIYQNFLRVFNQLDDVGAADFIQNLNARKPQS